MFKESWEAACKNLSAQFAAAGDPLGQQNQIANTAAEVDPALADAGSQEAQGFHARVPEGEQEGLHHLQQRHDPVQELLLEKRLSRCGRACLLLLNQF